ncbi:MAG: glycosyltransferase [Syntrophobacterales bacterium]|nr:glycosyltransferase [Syntrophobacterales bacterium]
MAPSGSPTKNPIEEEAKKGDPLGQILLRRGLITEGQLDEALRIQRERGGRLGWIILTQGWISRLELFKALSEHFKIPFWEFSIEDFEAKCDKTLINSINSSYAVTNHFIPFFKPHPREIIVLTDYPRENLHKSLEPLKEEFDVDTITPWIITDLDFTKLLQHIWNLEIADQAIYGLFFRHPEQSAIKVFTRNQVIFLGILIYASLLWLYLKPISFISLLFGFIQALFSILVLYKTLLSLVGAKYEMYKPITEEELKELKDEDLPVYTILVPVYKEPEVIGHLVRALKKMNYPQNKLDIILLLEEDDKATLEAAKRERPPGNWRFLVIPHAIPKTKPKACNYGLFFARGTYLTIYDAEDIPEPDQLKKAVVGFKKHGPSCVCLQAALNYFNSNENLITRMFTLEYSYWFDYLLPGLDKLKLPIPLGGTSNHFRTDLLKQLGGWDPFNVTEDADLGVRASAHGMTVGVINSTTYEEANSKYWNWVRQRSRWIKGYMQTSLVYNRHPIKMIKTLGIKQWISFQLFVGGTPFLFLAVPIVWSIFVYWVFTQTKIFDPFFPPILVYWGLFNLLWGNFLGVYLNMIAVFRRKLHYLMPYSLFNPIYWLCFHSIAAYKALWQLFFKPFYWEKTEHGITKFRIKTT